MKRLRVERNPRRREQIIQLGRKALMRWFLVGAKNLLKGVIPLNRRDQQFVTRHRADLKIISNSRFSDEQRKKALLKRGGAGFLGGVIIRHLLKWDETKKRRKVNPLAGRRRGAADPDSPVTRGRRRRVPPIVEEEEEMEDSDATIIPSPQSIMADSPELALAPPPLPPTPVRRRPNVRYTKRKLVLEEPAPRAATPRAPKKRKLPPWMVGLNQEVY